MVIYIRMEKPGNYQKFETAIQSANTMRREVAAMNTELCYGLSSAWHGLRNHFWLLYRDIE